MTKFPEPNAYDQDEYFRNKDRFIEFDGITEAQAKEFFDKDIVSDSIMVYFIKFLKHIHACDIIRIQKPYQLSQYAKLNLCILIGQDNGWFAYIWKPKAQTHISFNQVFEINKQLESKFVNNYDFTEYQLSQILQSVILFLQFYNLSLQEYKDKLFDTSENQYYDKWLIAKQSKIIHRNDVSNILEGEDLSPIKLPTQVYKPKDSFNLSSIKSEPNSQTSKYSSQLLPQLNAKPQNLKPIPKQINKEDLSDIFSNVKNEIINKQNDSEHFFSNRPEFYDGQTSSSKVKMRLNDLVVMLKDFVNNRQLPVPDSQVDLQYLLQYYYQNNPEQYKVLLNQYSGVIQEQLYEKMGLKAFNSQNPNQARFHERNSALSQKASFINKSQSHQSQGHFNLGRYQRPSKERLYSPVLQQITQTPIVAQRYNRTITRKEMDQFKDKLILSQNMLDFYLKILGEMHSEYLIMTTKFYETLLTSHYEGTKQYTAMYHGKNNIFEIFQMMIIPIKLNQYEYVGAVFNFQRKMIYFIDTIDRKHRSTARVASLIDNPILARLIEYVKTEHNYKVMRSFDILYWKFVHQESCTASDFKHSPLVLCYIIDRMCRKLEIIEDNRLLKKFAENVLSVIHQVGLTNNKKHEIKVHFD